MSHGTLQVGFNERPWGEEMVLGYLVQSRIPYKRKEWKTQEERGDMMLETGRKGDVTWGCWPRNEDHPGGWERKEKPATASVTLGSRSQVDEASSVRTTPWGICLRDS